ncbi:MAG: DUF4058 family protein [Zavarzinella sp.]|nr:DUF4058 family protein [Zavarzinella sp.]
MPLRDHFRPPVSTTASWEGFHGMWPGTIVQQLRTKLPPGYVAEPRVHLGQPVGSEPVLTVETDLPDEYQYEVRVYDVSRGRQLVAAVEIVSPANKDRAEKRNAFIAKCAALLQKGVAVSVIDLVTTRRFNLYTDLLAFIGHRDPTMSDDPPAVYAASCRWVPRVNKNYLEAWSYPLVVGQPLPTLPLWLAADSCVPLDLESSYEQACHDVWIP